MPSTSPDKAKDIYLCNGQSFAFVADTPVICMVTGVQGGKSTVGALWLCKKIMENPYEDYMLLASSYKMINQAPGRTFRKFATRFKLGEMNEGEDKMYWEIMVKGKKTGGLVYFRSADNPDKFEGVTVKDVWFDEAGDAPERAWINIHGRVAIKQGQIMVTSTPYSFNWLYDLYTKLLSTGKIEKYADGTQVIRTDDFTYVNYPSYRNPSFPKKSYDRAKRTLSPAEFNRRYNGLFTRPDGLVYQAYQEDTMVWSQYDYAKHVQNDPLIETIAAVDWGWNDPNVILVIGITAGSPEKPGMFVVLDEWYMPEVHVEAVGEQAKLMQKKYNIGFFYADAASPDRIAKLNSAGVSTIPVYKQAGENTNTYIAEGISRIRSLMLEDRFRVLDHCENTRKELGLYAYQRKEVGNTMVTLDKAEDRFNHTMDCLRYAIHSHWPRVRVADLHTHQSPYERLVGQLTRPTEDNHYEGWYQDL